MIQDSISEIFSGIGGQITISAASIGMILRYLISVYFSKQKELKELESKLNEANDKIGDISFKHLIENLEKDINGLGTKLREFELRIDNRIRELIKLETSKGNL